MLTYMDIVEVKKLKIKKNNLLAILSIFYKLAHVEHFSSIFECLHAIKYFAFFYYYRHEE